MLVCICKGISDKDIDNAMQEGASTFRDLHNSLGLGSNCGGCASFAKEMLHEKIMQTQSVDAFNLAYEVRI